MKKKSSAPARKPKATQRATKQTNPKSARKARGSRGAQAPPGSQSFGAAMTVSFPTGKNYRKRTSFETPLTKEYIGEILGSSSTTAVVQSLAVNPGQVATFPLLSSIAKLYEKYRFKMLRFLYQPEVSQYATGGQTGKVIFAWDYDASDAAPTTKVQAEDTDIHCDCMGYQAMVLAIPSRDNVMPFRYVRPGGLPGSADIKTYDVGILNALSYNNGTTGALGELWVEYICEFDIRINENTLTAPSNYSVTNYMSVSTGETGAATATPITMLFANTAPVNGLAAVNTSGSIVLPAGNYLIDADVEAYSSSGALTALDVQFSLNAMEYDWTTNKPASRYRLLTGDSQLATGHLEGYFSLRSTDALTVVVTPVFSSGSVTLFGNLRIVAA